MTNLKDYTDVIRNATKENTFRDPHYRWSVKAINKNSVKLAWSYLEPDEGYFTISVIHNDNGDPDDLKVAMPGLQLETNYIVVGNDQYCDACDMASAVVIATRSAFHLAHKYY